MRPLAIRGACLATALGTGVAATLDAFRTGRGGLVPSDFAGLARGYVGRVPGVEAHALPPPLAAFDCRSNRLAAMALESDGFLDAVAEAASRHGPERIAVVVGSSTSGVLSCEEAFLARGADGALPGWFDYDHTHDLSALAEFVRARLGLRGPALTVSTACTSSARALIDAAHLIAAGVCEAAVTGGADSLCRMTVAGFASLGLVSPEPCRPFDAERRGISVGEGAGFVLLEPGAGEIAVLGAGSSADAYHMSSPRPDGSGSAAAIRAALASAGVPPAAIDAVSLHGTGTVANDAAEDAAIGSVFGAGMAGSSIKGHLGHAMGSSGVVAAVASVACIREGLLPPCLGLARPDPSFRTRVLRTPERRRLDRVLVNSLGFGGANAALVIGRA